MTFREVVFVPSALNPGFQKAVPENQTRSGGGAGRRGGLKGVWGDRKRSHTQVPSTRSKCRKQVRGSSA